MDDKVVLILPEERSQPVDQQLYLAMNRLGLHLESIIRHLSGVETTLEGNGKPGMVSEFQTVKEYQTALRQNGAMEAVQWANTRRNIETRVVVGLVTALVINAFVVVLLLVRSGVI